MHKKYAMIGLLAATLGIGAMLTPKMETMAVQDVETTQEEISPYEEGEAIIMYYNTSAQAKAFSANSFSDGITIVETCCFEGVDKTGISAKSSTGLKNNLYVSLVKSSTYSTTELVEKMQEQDNVYYAEPNYTIKALDTDPYKKYQWALKNTGQNAGVEGLDVNFERNNLANTTSERVIALVDTGMDYTNSDLQGVVWNNTLTDLDGEHGYDFYNDDADPMDDNGHGSHCSGIMAGMADNGIGISGIATSSNIKIMPLKILSGEGYGKEMAAVNAYNYIYKAQQQGINVVAINNSWGQAENSNEMKVLKELMDTVGELGALSVCAAGNDGEDNDSVDVYPSNFDNSYVVSVAASNEKDELAGFSNYGKENVDLAAPGADILSTVSYDTFNPGIYDDQSVLCDVYEDFSEGNLVQTVGQNATGSATEENDIEYGTYISESSFGGGGWWGNTQSSTSATMEVSLSNETYFGLEEDGGKSLKWTIKDAKRNGIYCLYLPYTAKVSNSSVYDSVMLKATGESSSSPVYVMDGVIGNNGAYSSQNCTTIGGAYVDDDSYWTHVFGQVQKKVTQETQRVLIIQLQAAAAGDYTIYLDDFGVSKANVDSSQFGKYDFYNGTSMATPYVTGALAEIANAYPDATAEERKNILLNNVRKSDALQGKVATGGVLDLSVIQSETSATDEINIHIPEEITLDTGATEKVAVEIFSENITEEELVWESNNTDIATVDEQGNVYAVSEGTATLVVKTKEGKTLAECSVVVKKADTEEVTTEEVTTEEITTEEVTTEEVTTEELTTEEVTTEEVTTEEPTTEKLTTEEVTTEESTTEKLTTEEVTTEEPTTEKLTTEEVTTEEQTTEELTTEEVTTEEPTTEKTTTEELTTEEPTTEKVTTEERTTEKATTTEKVTTEERTTEKATTTEKVTTEERTTEKATTTEKVTTEERTTEKATTTEKVTTEERTTEKATITEKVTTEEQTTEKATTTEKVTTEEPTTEELTTEERTTEKPTTEKRTTEKLTTEELTTEKRTTEKLTTEELTTEKQTTEKLTTEELTTEKQTTEKLTTEKLTTQERTTKEPTTEKLTTQERTTKEPTTEKVTTSEATTEKLTTEQVTTQKQTTQERTTEQVTTEQQTASKVILNAAELELVVGEYSILTAKVEPDEVEQNVIWSSSNSEIVTVDSNGKVIAKAPGMAVIKAVSADGKQFAECIVTVSEKSIQQVELTGLELTTHNLTLLEGEEETIEAVVQPESATQNTIIWSTSNASVATVVNGKIQAVAPGTAIIIAISSNGKFQDICNVEVKESVTTIPVEEIILTKNKLEMEKGQREGLSVTIKPENATEKELDWSSSDEKVAMVDSNGKVIALNPGVAVISVVTKNGKTAYCMITVKEETTEATIAVKDIQLSTNNLTMEIGECKELVTTILPENATNKTLIWETTNSDVVSVGQNGEVTAKATGVATIVVKSEVDGITAYCTVKVKAAETSEQVAEEKKSTEQTTEEQENATEQEKVTKPKKVTLLKKKLLNATKVKLTWKKQTKVTGYKVYCYNAKQKKYKLYKIVKKNTITIKGLKKNTTYKFKVRAYKKSGKTTVYGAYSKVITVKTKK